MAKLGVNIDHVATLRQARGGLLPSPAQAARIAQAAGADGITVHLREDRRHIQDRDLSELKRVCRVPLNLEMALHPGIIKIALRLKPEKICIVPERRLEVTTEGGLDAVSKEKMLARVVPRFSRKKIEVSLFLDPSLNQIKTAKRVGAHAVEIHTGTYAETKGRARKRALQKIKQAARLALRLGLKVNAGHGLDYENVIPVARIPGMAELNIGYSIICRSLFVGLRQAVREMKKRVAR